MYFHNVGEDFVVKPSSALSLTILLTLRKTKSNGDLSCGCTCDYGSHAVHSSKTPPPPPYGVVLLYLQT